MPSSKREFFFRGSGRVRKPRQAGRNIYMSWDLKDWIPDQKLLVCANSLVNRSKSDSKYFNIYFSLTFVQKLIIKPIASHDFPV